MTGKVPEHVVQQVARSADIVRLIGRHCRLRQRGKKLWGLCPFHKEKTPSFSVDPEQGLYYCFGCKEGGNVFTFLKKVEGLEFYDALRMLAREAGVDLSQYQEGPGLSRREVDVLREVSELAAAFYAKCLQKAKGSDRPRRYLKERQISDESVELWRIGYAPAGWEHLLQFARGRHFEPSVLEKAGLVLARKGAEGHYDRFRDRLMFPVRDSNARVIGFGARALSDEEEVKYLNSPEGPLFSKGRCFYGLSQAREAIRAGETAVIVEGYTDVIMAHQFGVKPVMAVLGTALTEYHARTLSALCERVILVFDADEAGQKSAGRSIEVLLGEDLEVRVASLEKGSDPCDYLLAHGADAFRERLEQSEDFLAFRLRRARQTYGFSTVRARSKVFEDLAELALKVRNEARRDMLIRQIAAELGIQPRSAWAYLERTWSRGRPPAPGPSQAPEQSPGGSADVYDKGAVLSLLGVLLLEPDRQQRTASRLHTEALQDCREKELLESLLNRCRKEGPVEGRAFVSSLQDPELARLASRAIAQEEVRKKNPSLRSAEERCEEYVVQFNDRKRDRTIEELRKAGIGEPSQAPGASSAPATAPAGTGGERDEELRQYYERRRQKDRESARLNPAKWRRRNGDER